MPKRKVHFEDEYITVEPYTRTRFKFFGKMMLEVRINNTKEKMDEPS